MVVVVIISITFMYIRLEKMRKNNSNTAHAERRKRYYNVAIKKLRWMVELLPCQSSEEKKDDVEVK